MSLFSTLQISSNALQANQIGLQVVGQNIANANTPNYSKETLVLASQPTQQVGNVLLGLGVRVVGVRQQVDSYLDQRLRSATSDSQNASVKQQTYQQLEGVLNDLGTSNNLSSAATKFFNSIQDVINNPSDTAARNLAGLQGQAFTTTISQLGKNIDQQRSDLDAQITGDVASANTLINQIAKLNVQIAQEQGGTQSNSDAVGLADQRNTALTELSKLIDVRVQSDSSGAANVFVGGDYLVFQGQARTLTTTQTTDRGVNVSQVYLADTKAPLQTQSGKIKGEIDARDSILGGYHDQLNKYAQNLSFEFNKLFSSGQGLSGYQSVDAINRVNNADASLEAAGLPYTPVSGTFNVQIYNSQTKLTQSTQISVDLNGLNGKDTTLNSLASQLNSVAGLSATVSPTGQLKLKTTSPNLQVAFSNDTSGSLAALGVNVFFTGTGANDLAINPTILNDPGKFAVSNTGIGIGVGNGAALAKFPDQALDGLGGLSLTQYHSQLQSQVAQNSAAATAVANGYTSYQSTLNGQRLALSGVSIDEETVQLLQYQRAYQASARVITTVNQLLDTLLKI